MAETWRSTLDSGIARIAAATGSASAALSTPSRQRGLRIAVTAIAVAWLLWTIVSMFWHLLPAPDAPESTASPIINPPGEPLQANAPNVDIDRLAGWHLFGEAGAAPAGEVLPAAQPEVRDGIERGARESRLALSLRGIVSSTDDGLGHAVIEHRNEQMLYAVGDKLPAGANVSLAKVLPDRVVIDNAGTYELLMLYEESDLVAQPVQRTPPVSDAARARAQEDPESVPDEVAAAQPPGVLAAAYRDRLYENPQSLAEVVQLSAVRRGDELVGYRVNPGSDPAPFRALGFEPGDIVTGVNGLPLNDPGNAMRLYQAMREASSASFELLRDGESVNLELALDAAGTLR